MMDWNGDGRHNSQDYFDMINDTKNTGGGESSGFSGRFKAIPIVALICLIIALINPTIAKLIIIVFALSFVAFP